MRANRKMKKTGPWIGLLALFFLSGCLERQWETSYTNLLSRSTTKSWNVVEFDVLVSDQLSVSEANWFAPGADIVWRGDPYGDRRAQIKEIVEAAAKNVSRYMTGPYPVRIEVEVEQFHAVSDRARRIAPAAVHNLQFKIRVFDPATGGQMVPTDRIRADFPAYTRAQASGAERLGLTQKVRITKYLEDVFKGWLDVGPDPRRTFTSMGR